MGRLTSAEVKKIAEAKASGEDYSRYVAATPTQVEKITGGSTPARATVSKPSSSSSSGGGGGSFSSSSSSSNIQSPIGIDKRETQLPAEQYAARNKIGDTPATPEQVADITGQPVELQPKRGKIAEKSTLGYTDYYVKQKKSYSELGLNFQQFKEQQTFLEENKMETFRYVDPKTGKESNALGTTILGLYFNDKIEEDFDKAFKQKYSHLKDLENYHPDTTFTKTEGGYQVNFPFVGAENWQEYKKTLKTPGWNSFGLNLAASATGEDFLGIPSAIEVARGNKEKALQIKVEALQTTKNVKFSLNPFDPEGSLSWYLRSPMGVAATLVTTAGLGSATAGIVGQASTRFPTAFAIGSKAVGYGTKAAIAGIAIKDVYETGYKQDEWGKVGGNLARLGLNYAVAKEGFKIGQSSAAGRFEKGAIKGRFAKLDADFSKHSDKVLDALNKGEWYNNKFYPKGTLTPAQEEKWMTAWKAGTNKGYLKQGQIQTSYMRSNAPKTPQPEPKFTNIENLKNKLNVRNFFKQHSVFRKQKIIGGAGSNKPLTGDYDSQYYSPYGKAEAEYIIKKMGYSSLKDVSDPHYLQRPGTTVTTYGGTAETPYKYTSGRLGIKWREQFTRLVHSSYNPAHAGRVKDVSESVRMLKQIYPKGVPVGSMDEFEFFAKGVETYPDIMKPTTSKIYFSKSYSDKLKDVLSKGFQKTMGWKFEKNYLKMTGTKIPTDMKIMKTQSLLPPSTSLSYSSFLEPSFLIGYAPSSSYASFSKSFSSKSFSKILTSMSMSKTSASTIKPSFSSVNKSIKPSISYKSISKPPSISPSISPSKSVSKTTSPSYSVSKSFSSKIMQMPIAPYIPLGIFGGGRKRRGFSVSGKKFKFRKGKVFDPFKGIKIKGVKF